MKFIRTTCLVDAYVQACQWHGALIPACPLDGSGHTNLVSCGAMYSSYTKLQLHISFRAAVVVLACYIKNRVYNVGGTHLNTEPAACFGTI